MTKALILFAFIYCVAWLPAATIIDSNITNSVTWTLDGSPYIIDGSITIASSNLPVVSVEAGVVVKFNSGSAIQLGTPSISSQKGGMIVSGTADNPVLFTANTDTPVPGYWSHIRTNIHSLEGSISFSYSCFEYGGSAGTGMFDVNGGDPVFDHCEFRYSQNYGIYHSSTNSHASISDTSFTGNGGYPAYCNVTGAHLIGSGNSFIGNSVQRILLHSVTLNVSCTWLNQGIPYEIENDLTIINGNDPLILPPGTQLLFRGGKGLVVGNNSVSSQYGALSATGVQFNSVDMLDPWLGLEFCNHCRASTLTSCTISNVSDTSEGAVRIRSSYMIGIDNCSFSQIDNYAIYAYEGKLFQISNCNFDYCQKTIAAYFKDMHKILSGNQYQNNSDNRVHCLGGMLQDSAVWTMQDTHILILADCEIRHSSPFPVLQIPYGSVLEFDSGIKFTIGYPTSSSYQGSLIATGVTFCGKESSAGYWIGLIFAKYGGSSILSGCTIRDAGAGGAAAIEANVMNATITGCSIFNNLGKGIFMANDTEIAISGNSIYNCGSYPLSLDANSVRFLGAGNNFVGNTLDQIQVRHETINISGVWRNPGVPYYLTGSVGIYSSSFPHLQIQPGTTIMLPHEAIFSVGYATSSSYRGSLEAEGVIFTRADEAAIPQGLVFNRYVNAGASILSGCVFEYMMHVSYACAIYVATQADPSFNNCIFRNNYGSALVGATDARAAVSDCQFINNGSYPIKISASSFDVVSGVGNSFSGNNPNRILLSGGTLTQNYTWDNPSIPVEVSSDIKVFSSSYPVLTINSGLTLLFAANAGLEIGYATSASYRGGLKAQGATFSALSGVQNGWKGITFWRYVNQDSYLSNCIIEYAGSGEHSNLYLNNASVTSIDGCIIRYGGCGIGLSGVNATPLISCNYVIGNEIGIECLSSANPLIGGSMSNANAIVGNSVYGVLSTTPNQIDASYNWWGHEDGPQLRLGDAISGNIIYLPYRQSNIGDAPANFDLLLPENLCVVQSLTPVLDWAEAYDPSPGDQVLYTLQISMNAGFTSDIIQYQNLTDTVFHLPIGVLQDDSHYFWRVIATDTQEQSTMSNQSFEFVTEVPQPPMEFQLLVPAQNEVIMVTSPLLVWQQSIDPDPGDAIIYRVYIDLTAAFDSADSLDTNDTQIYSNFCQPANLYYWKVIAFDNDGFSVESATRRFYVHPDAAPRAPAAIQISPADGITTLQWESVPGTDCYKVYFSEDPNLSYEYLGDTSTPQYQHLGTWPKGFYMIKTVDY